MLKKIKIICFLLLLSKVNVLMSYSVYRHLDFIQNNTGILLWLPKYVAAAAGSTGEQELPKNPFFIFKEGYSPLLPLDLNFHISVPSISPGPVAENMIIIEEKDKEAKSSLSKVDTNSLPKVAMYLQYLNGAQLNYLCSALGNLMPMSYNQSNPIGSFPDHLIYFIITNFNPRLDPSSFSFSELGNFDNSIIVSYRMQIIYIEHADWTTRKYADVEGYRLGIQVNKENVGYGLLTADNTGGQPIVSKINQGNTSLDFLYPSFISYSSKNNPKAFRFIIDLQGNLTSGKTLDLDNGISIMSCDVVDIGYGFHQDIPMLNLQSTEDKAVSVIANKDGSSFINLSVIFGKLQSTVSTTEAPYNNIMFFSLPSQALKDGVNIEVTQPVAGNYQLVITSTKDFVDSDGNQALAGSVLAFQKVFINSKLSAPLANSQTLVKKNEEKNPEYLIYWRFHTEKTDNRPVAFSDENPVIILSKSNKANSTKNLGGAKSPYISIDKSDSLEGISFGYSDENKLAPYEWPAMITLNNEMRKYLTDTNYFKLTYNKINNTIDVELIDDLSLVVDFLRMPNDQTWNSPQQLSPPVVGQTLNFNLQYSASQNKNTLSIKPILKNTLSLDACDYFKQLWYSPVFNYKQSIEQGGFAEILLESSFVDKINKHLYKGKSLILNIQSQKKDGTFDFTFVASDLDSKKSFAQYATSLKNSNSAILGINMNYTSDKINNNIFALNFLDSKDVSLFIQPKPNGTQPKCPEPKLLENKNKIKKEKKKKDKLDQAKQTVVTDSSATADQKMIIQLEQENKQLKDDLQKCLAQKKTK
jgi:hypothetical protein